MRLTWVAILVVLIAACPADDPNTVIRYGEMTVGTEELEHELARGAYAPWSGDPEKRLHLALRALVLQKWAGADPASTDEEDDLMIAQGIVFMGQCVGHRIGEAFSVEGDVNQAAHEYFVNHPGAFDAPERFRLQLIFLPRSQENAESVARELLGEVQADAERFAKLAARHSQSQTAWEGGATKTLDGPSIHPKLRAAVNDHPDGDPFLVEFDRGWYIVRVLQYIEAVSATFEIARPKVIEVIRTDYEDQLRRQLLEETGTTSFPPLLDETVVQLPWVDGNTPLFSLDNRTIRARHLAPVIPPTETVSGPSIRDAINGLRDLSLFAVNFGCEPEAAESSPSPSAVAALRLPERLLTVLMAEHRDELIRFHELHRGALLHPPSYVVDLAIFPYRDADRFADLEFYRPLMDGLASESPPLRAEVESAGAILLEDMEVTEPQIAAYDTDLVPALRTMATGLYSEYAASDPAQAFLMVRLDTRQGTRPLSIDDEADLEIIARALLAAEPDTALDAVYHGLTADLIDVDFEAARRAAAPYFATVE